MQVNALAEGKRVEWAIKVGHLRAGDVDESTTPQQIFKWIVDSMLKAAKAEEATRHDAIATSFKDALKSPPEGA
eukprot:1910777-Alexandrium_andersonii.AAC.1